MRGSLGDELQRPARLREVESIVTGDQPERQLEALWTALAVVTDPRSLLRRGPAPERDVRGPERLERRKELHRFGVRVPESLDPAVLVVPLQRRLVVGKDPSIPRRTDDLRVGDMADAFDDRPLTRLGPDPERVARVLDQLPEHPGRQRLDLGGIVVAE